jgi:predicted exporter
MSCVTGFMWPAFYWVTRSFVVDPVRRAKLWNGQLQRPDPIMDEE